jgi:hypothetical protein
MTDRVRTVIITLRQDTRTDDVECIVQALRMVKGVAEVRVGEPVSMDDEHARSVVRSEVSEKLHAAIQSVLFPPRGT